jgi:hypothetical protein
VAGLADSLSLAKCGNAGTGRLYRSSPLADWVQKPKPEPSFYGQEGSGLGVAENPPRDSFASAWLRMWSRLPSLAR